MTSMITTGRMGQKKKVSIYFNFHFAERVMKDNSRSLSHNKQTSYFHVAAKKRKSDKVILHLFYLFADGIRACVE